MRQTLTELPGGWLEQSDDEDRSAMRQTLTDNLHRLRKNVNSLRPSLSTDETRELNQILSDAAGLVRMKSDRREMVSELSDRFRNLSGRIEYSTETSAAENGPNDRRRGRKKADYETVQREARLAADWGQARESGVYKTDFAKQNKMTPKKLNALLNRVAKRKTRSDK